MLIYAMLFFSKKEKIYFFSDIYWTAVSYNLTESTIILRVESKREKERYMDNKAQWQNLL